MNVGGNGVIVGGGGVTNDWGLIELKLGGKIDSNWFFLSNWSEYKEH